MYKVVSVLPKDELSFDVYLERMSKGVSKEISKGLAVSYFFSNSIAKLNIDMFDISEIEMNLEATSDDNYLKTHNIKSAINNNQSLLNSFLIEFNCEFPLSCLFIP